MGLQVDTNGVIRPEQRGIKFRNPNTGQETMAVVHQNPNKLEGLPYKEGDQFVELSIEAFGELMSLVGYFPVDPKSDAVVIPDHLLEDKNEEYAVEQEETDE